MFKIFIGYDPRQPVAFQVLAHSIYTRSSVPVSITPLVLSQLPIKRRGLTDFTFSRYLVPYLCEYKGTAVFLDSDMLCLGDISKLETNENAVSVVKSKQKFEWPSLMVFNAGHPDCRKLTPGYVETGKPHTFEWVQNIGEVPDEWNHCVGYDKPNPNAKLVHFTAGIPCFPETKNCEFSEEWNREAYKAVSSVSWEELLGNSVHAKMVKA